MVSPLVPSQFRGFLLARSATCISQSVILAWSRIAGTRPVTLEHALNYGLTPEHKLKCYDCRLRALKRSSHPPDLVAAPACTRSMPANGSSCVRSSFITDEMFFREFADADMDAFLSPWEYLALCPTEFVEHSFAAESNLARVLPSMQRVVRCLAGALHWEPRA